MGQPTAFKVDSIALRYYITDAFNLFARLRTAAVCVKGGWVGVAAAR